MEMMKMWFMRIDIEDKIGEKIIILMAYLLKQALSTRAICSQALLDLAQIRIYRNSNVVLTKVERKLVG